MRGLLIRICPLLGLVAVVGLSSPADAGKQGFNDSSGATGGSPASARAGKLSVAPNGETLSVDRQVTVRPAAHLITKFKLPPGRTLSEPSQVRIIPIPTTWDAVMIPIPTEIDAKIVPLKTKP